ncbi:MAG: DNA polymerase III subunit delta [Planctomycetes bacterium]|nr:DNA polymerase III subunit delta [Planctomycetota bacterium]MBI3847935.1 DNA polymerase III subunit delta [Planctomycetota bacterium]
MTAKLATATRARVLAIVGDEAHLKEEALRAAIRERFPEGDPGAAIVTFRAPGKSSDPEDGTIASFFGEVETAPLFGGTKLVVVREADALTSEEKTRVRLEAALGRIPSKVELVLIFDSLPQNTRVAKRIAEIGARVECKKPYARVAPWKAARSPYETPLVEWIVDRARERGLRIEPSEAFLLGETVGDDLGMLDSELEKLDLYLGPATTGPRAVRREHVEALAAGGRTFPAFDLADAVARRDRGEAIRILRILFDQGLATGDRRVGADAVHVLLIGAIHGKLQRAAIARGLLDQGRSADEVADALKVPPFLRRPFAAELRTRTRDELESALRRLFRADLDLKGAGIFPDAIVERLVIDLTEPAVRA